MPTPTQVVQFLGWDQGDTDALAMAEAQLSVVQAFVEAYTRGQGFTNHMTMEPALDNVILTATARLMVNPHQNKREEIGDYSVVPPTFNGFTLIEQTLLHAYRKRAS